MAIPSKHNLLNIVEVKVAAYLPYNFNTHSYRTKKNCLLCIKIIRCNLHALPATSVGICIKVYCNNRNSYTQGVNF